MKTPHPPDMERTCAWQGVMGMIVKGCVVGTLGLAVLCAAPARSVAKPKKLFWSCKCACVAYDQQGYRHEGNPFSFDTGTGLANDCGSIGWKMECTIDTLKGRYAACTGKSYWALEPTNPNPSSVSPGTFQSAPLQR